TLPKLDGVSQVHFKKTRYDSIAKRISIFKNTRHKFTSEVWRETPVNNCSFIITKIIELRDTMKKFMRMTALKKNINIFSTLTIHPYSLAWNSHMTAL
ncbi:9256_t:CDS:1, partial [Rhizophagus irregularis]